MKPKVCFISMHPAPYRDPVLSELSKDSQIEFEVLSLYKKTTHKEWDLEQPAYKNYFLKKPLRILNKIDIHLDIFNKFSCKKYDIVFIPGYWPIISLFIIFICLLNKSKIILSIDTIKFGKHKPSFWHLKSWIFHKANAFWIPGLATKQYLMDCFSIPKEKIFCGSYLLDKKSIEESILLSKDSRIKIRDQLNLTESDFLFLFVGKLIPSRNIKLLLDSYLQLFKINNSISVLIIGDGEQKQLVREYISKYPYSKIHLIESVNFKNLHSYYYASDGYVHPGCEPYSLALQEAVIFKLPILCTDGVGAAYDLVQDGENGIIISRMSTCDEFSNALNKIILLRWNYVLGPRINKLLRIEESVSNSLAAINYTLGK